MCWVHVLQGIMNYLFFSHLIFVITWDQISPGDRSFCSVSLKEGGKKRKKRSEHRRRCTFRETKIKFLATQMHLMKLKSVCSFFINSLSNEDSEGENTAIHTHTDVNKFYLPTFPNTSNCQAHGGSLSQERASLRISLSHLPLEDSPLVPIANIKVKHTWETEFSGGCHISKNNMSSSASELIKTCQRCVSQGVIWAVAY